jgi:hypothetical protein
LIHGDGKGELDIPDYVDWVVVERDSYCNNSLRTSGGEVKSPKFSICAPRGFSDSVGSRELTLDIVLNVLASRTSKKVKTEKHHALR